MAAACAVDRVNRRADAEGGCGARWRRRCWGMRILSLSLLLAVAASLASCAAPPPPPAPAPPPPPPAAPVSSPPVDWRDLPLTPGNWLYRAGPDGPEAIFGVSGASPVLAIRCPIGGKRIAFQQTGALGPGMAATMRLTASSGTTAIAARPASGTAPQILADTAASDPILDKIAYSRGRFVVETSGQARLVLPAWPEVARVIEFCRN